MIKACPICGRVAKQNCYHEGVKVDTIMLPVEGALNLAVQHTLILSEQVTLHLGIVKKLRGNSDA